MAVRRKIKTIFKSSTRLALAPIIFMGFVFFTSAVHAGNAVESVGLMANAGVSRPSIDYADPDFMSELVKKIREDKDMNMSFLAGFMQFEKMFKKDAKLACAAVLLMSNGQLIAK